MRKSRAKFLYLALSAATVAMPACSSDKGGVSDEQGAKGASGKLDLALTLADGTTIDSVDYTITGPGSFTKTGSIDVANSTTVSALISPIPAGAGYTITLSTTANESASCSGS